MAKSKLNFRFHNPNTAETTADYILKIFIEANREKVEQAMQTAAEISAAEPLFTYPDELETTGSHST